MATLIGIHPISFTISATTPIFTIKLSYDDNTTSTMKLHIEPFLKFNGFLAYSSKKYHEKAIAIKKANAALDDLDE